MNTIVTSNPKPDYATEAGAGHVTTWAIQVLLGLLFVFAGTMKFVMPLEEMTKTMPLPAAFLYFIGLAEVCGGLGLILPGALRIRRGLTVMAALGLLIIMVGAVALTLPLGPVMAATPFLVGALSGFVAYRRWAWLAA